MVQPLYTHPLNKNNLLFPFVIKPNTEFPYTLTKYNIQYTLSKEDKIDEDKFMKSVTRNMEMVFELGKSNIWDYLSEGAIRECVNYLWVVMETMNADSFDSKIREIFLPDSIIVRFAKFYKKNIYEMGEKHEKEYRIVVSYIRNSSYPTIEDLDSRSKMLDYKIYPGNPISESVCYHLECYLEFALLYYDPKIYCWDILKMGNSVNLALGFYVMGKVLMNHTTQIDEMDDENKDENDDNEKMNYIFDLCKKSLDTLYILEGLEY